MAHWLQSGHQMSVISCSTEWGKGRWCRGLKSQTDSLPSMEEGIHGERETETHREKLRDKYGFSEKNNHCSSLLETLSYLVVFAQGLGVYKAPCTCWWITSFVSVLYKWDNRLGYSSSEVMETEQIYALRPCATCFPGYQDYVYWMGCRQVWWREMRDQSRTGRSDFPSCRERQFSSLQVRRMKRILSKFGIQSSIHPSHRCLLKAGAGDRTHPRTPVFMESVSEKSGNNKGSKVHSILVSDKYQGGRNGRGSICFPALS